MRLTKNIHVTAGVAIRRHRLFITLLTLSLVNVIVVMGNTWRGEARVNEAVEISAGEKTGGDSSDPNMLTAHGNTTAANLKRVPKVNGRIVFTSFRDLKPQIYTMKEDGTDLKRLTNTAEGDAEPAWSPDGKRIAFVSHRDGNEEIYVMNADGSNQTRLTNNSERDVTPTWSPDGNRIAFTNYDGPIQISVINADGSNFKRLGQGGFRPAWSPDGTQIAFVNTANGGSDIFTMSADGTNAKNISNAAGEDLDPAWSPDGKKIAFGSNKDGNYEIYLMNADGSNPMRLTNNTADDSRPVWSPDGTRITFDSERDGNTEIYMMKADGTNQTRSTNEASTDLDPHWQPLPANGRIVFMSDRDGNAEIYSMLPDGSGLLRLTNDSGKDLYPSYSPDGTKIAFSSNRTGARLQIHLMNADGTNPVRLTQSGMEDAEPVWSPDGKKIAFRSARDGNDEIYVMDADGSNQTRLTSDAGSDGQPTWSADGKRIAFVSNRDGNKELYLVNADGTGLTRLTNSAEQEVSLEWSPDGSKILFISIAGNNLPTAFVMNQDGSNIVSTNRRAYDATWSPDGTQIALIDVVDNSYEILLMNPDGNNLTRLTSEPATDEMPSWGPASTTDKIAFKSERDGNPEIYVMYADGALPTNLTDNSATDEAPAWSPDGAKLAFYSDRDGNFEIYSMNAQGSDQTRLTNDPATDNNPSWSPDAKRIVFNSDRDGNQELYLMNADGTGQTRITNHNADDLRPAWSPDGTRIAFQSTRDGHNEIYLINPDGTGEVRLTQGSADNYLPAWSPDGARIAFTSLRDGNAEIYLMNIDGTGQINISQNSAHDTRPSWSSDGKQIVFNSVRDGNAEVYVMKTDGTGQTRLTANSAKDDEPAWRPETPAPTFGISGRITESSTGLSGVTLTLSGAKDATTTTDSNGNYSFTNLPDGNYAVTPSKSAYIFSPQSKSFVGLVSNQTADFTATLVTYTVSGTIKYGQNPLKDVQVVLDNGEAGAQTYTDSNGFYSFTVKAGAHITLTPSKDFYTFNPSSYTFSGLNTNLTVDFTAGQETFTLSGNIIDGLADPLAGVTVTLSGDAQASTTTDGDGNYSFKDLVLDGTYTVTPSKDQYDFSPLNKTIQKLDGNKTADFRGTIKGYKITGRVKDGAGNPLPNVQISVKDGAGNEKGPTSSDQNGNYEVAGLGALGNYTVTAVPTQLYSFTPAEQKVSNLTGDQALSDFTGTPVNYTISGKITNGTDPLSGVTVKLSGGKSDTVTTNSNGEYAFTGVPASSNYSIVASKTNYTFSPVQIEINNLDSDRQENNFVGTLVRFSISGFITDEGGQPMSNASVHLDGGDQSSDGVTDNNGRYKFSSLIAERDYTITVSVPNYQFSPQARTYKFLSENITTADFAGSLLHYTISGTVSHNNGGPLAGATVTLSGSQTGSTTTDGDGNYFFSNLLAKGNYTVSVSKVNYTFQQPSRTFNDLGGNQGANFHATRNFYAINVQVKNSGGSPMVNVPVSISSAGKLLLVNSTDNAGQLTFGNLEAERDFTLAPTLSGWSFSPADKTFSTLSGNETVEFIGTQLTNSIGGQITLAGNGGPVADVTVTLSGDRQATAVSDATGKYSFGQLPVGGSYTVTPSKPNFTFDPPSQTIQSLSGNQEVYFAATGVTYSITGQVSNDKGLFIAGVTVTLAGPVNRTTTTDVNGNYGFFNLTAGGDYTVTPALSGYQFAPQNKSVANLSGDQSGVNFTAASTPSVGISGHITEGGKGITGVTVALGGSQSKTVSTDANGFYSFDGLTADGTYTVTPALAPYTFAPNSRTFTNMNVTQSNVDFTATRPVYTISGVIRDQSQKGIGGVTVTLTGSANGSATTDGNGFYSFTNLGAGGNYTLTPSKIDYTFTPERKAFLALGVDQIADFTGTTIPGAVRFDQSAYGVTEGAGSLHVTVQRTGNLNTPAVVHYATTDAAGLQNCDVINGIASPRCDFANVVGDLHFAPGDTIKTIFLPVVDDVYVEGPETLTIALSHPGEGATLGSPDVAVITITDNGNDSPSAANPIENTEFFVRQHYIDFLGREPDSLWVGWINQINNCPAGDAGCDRLSVSRGIYLSPEFIDRGLFIYKIYGAALGRKPSYQEFIVDRARVSGFQTQAELEQSKADLIADFMGRNEFRSLYDSQTAARAFVESLLAKANMTYAGKEDLIGRLSAGGVTRAGALREVVESAEANTRFLNEATIVMHYFGYLRRDPDAAYQDWINILTSTGDSRNVTNGFVNSQEYRMRFAR